VTALDENYDLFGQWVIHDIVFTLYCFQDKKKSSDWVEYLKIVEDTPSAMPRSCTTSTAPASQLTRRPFFITKIVVKMHSLFLMSNFGKISCVYCVYVQLIIITTVRYKNLQHLYRQRSKGIAFKFLDVD